MYEGFHPIYCCQTCGKIVWNGLYLLSGALIDIDPHFKIFYVGLNMKLSETSFTPLVVTLNFWAILYRVILGHGEGWRGGFENPQDKFGRIQAADSRQIRLHKLSNMELILNQYVTDWCFFCSSIGSFPTDELIFFRGVAQPSTSCIYIYTHIHIIINHH